MGIVALHVESGRALGWRETETFEGASIVKLALLVEALARSREGTLELYERWPVPPRAVAAGSGVLDEFEPWLAPTQRDLLRLMMALSDNTSANHFIDAFGAEAVNCRMASIGLAGIELVGRIPDRGSPEEGAPWEPLGRMTPRDTAELWRRAVTGTLLDKESSRLAMRLAANPRTANRIPRLLASRPGFAWAGKTGTMSGVRADSGVLTTPKGTFVFAIFADEIPGRRLAGGEQRHGGDRQGDRRRVVEGPPRPLPDRPLRGAPAPAGPPQGGADAARGPRRRTGPRARLPRRRPPLLGAVGEGGRRPRGRLPRPDAELLLGRVAPPEDRAADVARPPPHGDGGRRVVHLLLPRAVELRLLALPRRAGRSALPVRLARAPGVPRGRLVPPRPVGPEPELGRRRDHRRREPDSVHARADRDRHAAHRRPDGAVRPRGAVDRRAPARRPRTARSTRARSSRGTRSCGAASSWRRSSARSSRPRRNRNGSRPRVACPRAQTGTTPSPGPEGRSQRPSFRTSPFHGSFATRRFPSRSSQS